ncbi:MAG: SRPBCC domain-containing protein [Candidatus Thorarchaeota archaeon]|nr:MAG: SRPBCC domain-containing protein [Candidatus Thorarchaeota archaeon]
MTKVMDVEIRHSTLIRASPEEVYDALTTAEAFNTWFTTESQIEARPGGSFYFKWKDWGPDKISVEDSGPIVEATRPEKFLFKWHGENNSYYTTVEILLERVEEGTAVRLREYGYQDTPSGRQSFMNCSTGWGEALTLLKFYVEHGVVY